MDEDAVFQALADRTRRALLDRLFLSDGQSLTQLCASTGMSRQGVSKHLLQLEHCGLVTIRWEGRQKHHYLNPVPIHAISQRWIGKFQREPLDALSNLKRELEGRSDGE